MDSTNDPLALTKAKKRPRSQGSTASIHSAATQPNLDHAFTDVPEVYQSQWIPNDHTRTREFSHSTAQMTQDDMMLASQLHTSREFAMESQVNASMSTVQYHGSHSMSRQSLSADSFAGNTSFVEDSQMVDPDGNNDHGSYLGIASQAKGGSRSSANNEVEMRQLYMTNKHRDLQEVAEELHGNERGPNSERTRQVFAMLWISQVCSKGKGSVPRGRVYANYASRCATERITVLNPASFGKLVRVLFPGLKTRRLGVRGESKYHYVNFQLREDQPDVRDVSTQPQVSPTEEQSFSQTFSTTPDNAVTTERAVLPTPDLGQPEARVRRSHEYVHSLYNQVQVANIDQLNTTLTKTVQKLCFAPESEETFQQSDPLVLPRIEPFLPQHTDPDAAKSLAALYRSHCTSLVECIRYCKEKTFFHLYTSFQGTLTMPVQKLFSNPAVAPWIEECDFVLYQRMMRIISSLVLQVVPKTVLDTLRNISDKLVQHIRDSFQGQPPHVLKAKEAPATLFAGLLDRVLRVNLTAHAAANMLSNPGNRDIMYLEWMSIINLRKIAENVPSRAMDDVVNLLLKEMRGLLDPIDVSWEIEAMTLHGEMAMRNGQQPEARNPEESTVSNVLDHWVSFLRSLPSHFPYASPTDIVWCVQRVGTAVMRDITMGQGKSFGSWWVTKCFIDEMILFLAECGGFLKQKSTHEHQLLISQQQKASNEASNGTSRYRSGSDDSSESRMSESQPDRARFPVAASTATQPSVHDDSGIGIRTPDEDSPIQKFGFQTTNANTQDIFAGTELQDEDHLAEI
ncbi:RFX DNA-binding domain-containing protein [Sordaria brevicollis]|uniref:RFX DNA-binding domain-containing protein n=1 Tax=Sordaria brevicollis TaxID=83679 RepID=A0AAE0PNB1_SORBR|nr:RFX DNA-binding domain-containing protein [Sordaria brevicollis]